MSIPHLKSDSSNKKRLPGRRFLSVGSMHKSPTIAVDVVIFTIENDELKILLIKRNQHPFKNSWALPGGFLHYKETTQSTVKRVLDEKAGIRNVYVEQLYTFDSINRDPRGRIISIAYFALVPLQNIKIKSGKNTQTPTLFSVNKMPVLGFDHKIIIQYARKRLQAKLEYTSVVFSLLPNYFSLNQLQKTYETILGVRLDKRNFRKKFDFLNLIKPTDKVLVGARQRPAKLYQFSSRKLKELKKFF